MKKSLITLFIAGSLIALFPWLFSYQGTLLGQPVSIRAMGDALGVVLVLFGLSAIFSASLRARAGIFLANLDALPALTQNRVMGGAVGVFLLGAISHKLRAHYVLATHAYDLGFFSNICWNTANGNWFWSSDLERNFMSVHVNWVLWPLSYIYKVWAGAPVLLMAQAVIVAASVPILWKLAQRITGAFSFGAIASMLFVCSPYIEHALSNDFHPDLWLLPCLFAALSAWQRGERSWVLCFSFFSLLAKEDVSVVLCGFGIMLFFWRGWRLTGAAMIAMALSVFYFHTKIFIPRFLDGASDSLLFSRYPLLGQNYEEFAKHIWTEPVRFWNALAYEPSKYWRLLCYVFPVGGLVLLAPVFLIPPLVSVAPHILSQAGTQLSLADIYAMPAQPFLFVGAVFGARRLITNTAPVWHGRLAAALVVVAGFGVFNSPRYFKSQPPTRIAAFQEARRLIPPDATLAAQHNLQPHFETRRYIQLFPIRISMYGLQRRVLENPEFIICDRIGNAEPGNGEQFRIYLAALESNVAYEKIFEKENFMVFKRKKEEPMLWREIPT